MNELPERTTITELRSTLFIGFFIAMSLPEGLEYFSSSEKRLSEKDVRSAIGEDVFVVEEVLFRIDERND